MLAVARGAVAAEVRGSCLFSHAIVVPCLRTSCGSKEISDRAEKCGSEGSLHVRQPQIRSKSCARSRPTLGIQSS